MDCQHEVPHEYQSDINNCDCLNNCLNDGEYVHTHMAPHGQSNHTIKGECHHKRFRTLGILVLFLQVRLASLIQTSMTQGDPILPTSGGPEDKEATSRTSVSPKNDTNPHLLHEHRDTTNAAVWVELNNAVIDVGQRMLTYLNTEK